MSRKSTRFAPTLRDYARAADVERVMQGNQGKSEPRTVRVVETLPGGKDVVVEELICANYNAAFRRAEEIQEQADNLGLARRCYVVDRFGVPVAVAGISDRGREQQLALQKARGTRT